MPKVMVVIVIAKVEEELLKDEDFRDFIKRARAKYADMTGDKGVLLRVV